MKGMDGAQHGRIYTKRENKDGIFYLNIGLRKIPVHRPTGKSRHDGGEEKRCLFKTWQKKFPLHMS